MNAEVVRRGLALAYDPREDIPDEELAELFTPAVVIDMSARVFNPHVYEGFDGLRQYRVDLREVWDSVVFDPQEVIEQGDHVLATSRMKGYGRGSGVPIDEEGSALYRLAGGRIQHVRFLGLAGRDEALAALHVAASANCPEPPPDVGTGSGQFGGGGPGTRESG